MFENYKIEDLKNIYNTLSLSVTSNLELMDSDFLQDLQTYLQKVATKENYDVSLHADWENFLRGSKKALKSL